MVKTDITVTFEEITLEKIDLPLASSNLDEGKGYKRLTINLTTTGMTQFGVGHLTKKGMNESFYIDLREAIEEYNRIQ